MSHPQIAGVGAKPGLRARLRGISAGECADREHRGGQDATHAAPGRKDVWPSRNHAFNLQKLVLVGGQTAAARARRHTAEKTIYERSLS